jgi:hypothetical protein
MKTIPELMKEHDIEHLEEFGNVDKVNLSQAASGLDITCYCARLCWRFFGR